MSGGRTSTVRLRGRLTASWSAGSHRKRAAILLGGTIAAAFVGAFLFGAWHILFGGFVKGNWRAGGFGLALAAASGTLLVVGAAVARRLLG